MQRCLLYGDWDAATGVALDELEPSVHLVKPFECPAHWPFISGFDWGFSHWSVFMWGRIDDDGRIWVCDTIKKRLMRDWDLAGAMKESAPVQALRNVQSGHDCWHERRDRGENAPQTAEYFLGQHIHLVKANIDRAMGYANLLQYFAWRPTAYLPQRQPMVQFFDTPGNRWLVEDHLPSLVMDPDDPRDVLKVDTDGESGRGGDDGYDCIRYMLASRVMKAQSGSSNRIVSAWDPDVLRKEAEKFRRPQTAPVVGRLARLKEGVFLGG
jgi:hypothetical protein